MPLIDFPDIPDLPGVPAIPRLPSNITSAVGAVLALRIADAAVPRSPEQWQITDQNGSPLLTPDAVIDFEYRGEMKIPKYPMEQGSFSSYNKVYVPFSIHVTVACNGRGQMTRQQFLTAIETMRANPTSGLAPVSIITPDQVYGPCNLMHVDYRREARNGVSLILARLWFEEIRIYGTAIPQSAQPSGSAQQNLGQTSPATPTTQQQAAYSSLQTRQANLMSIAQQNGLTMSITPVQ